MCYTANTMHTVRKLYVTESPVYVFLAYDMQVNTVCCSLFFVLAVMHNHNYI